MREVLQMNLVALKIDVLKNILNQEIEENGFKFNHKILVLSQILDEFIVEYQRGEEEDIVIPKRAAGGGL
jgi:hypothetical protein